MKMVKYILGAVLSLMTLNAHADGLPAQKVLSWDAAQLIVQGAIAKCRAEGHKVSVAVVDNSNVLKAFGREDGAYLGTVQMAQTKAFSVVAFGRATGPRDDQPSGTPPPLAGMTSAAGGIPIMVGDQLVGAVAVSGVTSTKGAPGAQKDKACAMAGLERAASLLK
jgi:uncharacterized protein GlcG (DUF336 family)